MPHPDVPAWAHLQQRLRDAGERRMVVLEGDRDTSLAWLGVLLPELASCPGLWVGTREDSPHEELQTVTPGNARHWLGRELLLVVWDGWKGNPPDSLAALTGTLMAGGLFFWLMPPLGQWQDYADPDYWRTGLQEATFHPFADRMAGILARDPSVIRVHPERNPRPALPEVRAGGGTFKVGSTSEQQALKERLVHLGLGRRRRPLVITADRGRGKSAAMGLAAVELLRQGRRHILVTAPEQAAVQALFHHARLAAAQSLERETPDGELVLENGASLRFLPVRELLAQHPDAEVVLVDEAAAIPAPLLSRVLLGWPRVAFATTVHGYEGSGRGFAIRFRDVLDRHTPHWQTFTLSQPIRWVKDDPLEDLTRRLFLLDAQSPEVGEKEVPLEVERWSPATASEDELKEAFGLLVDAHYRTSPGDLRQWMDDPQAVSWRVFSGRRLVGVLWATREGGLSPDLAEEVGRGRRRVRGHLLAQSLANHSGFPEAATLTLLRIVRVAVCESLRGKGVGQKLVAATRDYAREQGLDGVGTSFGGSVELVRFWRRGGLQFVRAGFQREASSGEYPVQMLAGLTADGKELCQRLTERLSEHWLTLVPLNWQAMEPHLLTSLTLELARNNSLNQDDRRDLVNFGEGYRGFLLTLPVLRKLSLQPGVLNEVYEREEASLWCRSVLQGWSWPQIQGLGACRGQREGEDRLRRLVCHIMQNRHDL